MADTGATTKPAPFTPAAMAERWGREDLASGHGSESQFSAAMWSLPESDEPIEIDALADPDTHILSPILEGSVDCELFLDGRRQARGTMEMGSFNLVRKAEAPRAVEYKAGVRFLHLYMPDALLQRVAVEMGAASVELLPIAIARDPVVAHLARLIEDEISEAQPAMKLMLDTLGLQLAVHLVRNWSSLANRQSSHTAPLVRWQVTRVREYIDANIAEDITLGELAGLVGLSSFHFCRAFRAAVGEPPHAWLVRRRVGHAMSIMRREPHLTLMQVAQCVGP